MLMKYILAAALVAATFQDGNGFQVEARERGKDTLVTLTYPAGLDRLWTCVIMNHPSDLEYKPRWCWAPRSGKDAWKELYVIPNWPPVGEVGWKVQAFLQYLETPDQTEGFGYTETEWGEVR